MKKLLISNMFPTEKFPEYGTFVKNFYLEMNKQGFDFQKSVLYKKSNSKIIKSYSYLVFYFSTLFKLIRGNYKFIYIHYISHSSLPLLLVPKKYTIVANVHGSDINPKGKFKYIFKRISKKILEKSDLIVVPSSYYKQIVIDSYSIHESKIYVSPSGGVDLDKFCPVRNQKKEDNRIILGFAGRLVKEKGWRTLLDSILLLDKENIELKIVGNGKDEKEIHRFIEDNNLGEMVSVTGAYSQEELSNFYNDIDCFIFPTENSTESLGLVGLESMASGCLLIASDHPAVLSYLNNELNGFTFKLGDSEELALVIKKVIRLERTDREQIIQSAIETSKEYCSNKVSQELGIRLKDLIN